MNLTLDRTITKDKPFKICFVCLGNICRSPTAEGVFRHLVNERSLQSYFEIDSAGTSAYHIGEGANAHSQRVANQNGVELHSRARRFEAADLGRFDLLLAMDADNVKNMRRVDAESNYGTKIMLLREFDPQPGDKQVPDPYAGGRQGFENVFAIIERSCENLLNKLESFI